MLKPAQGERANESGAEVRRPSDTVAPLPCAGDNTVAALLTGTLDEIAAHRLERHLDACASCRKLVADLGRGLSAIGAAPAATPGPALPKEGDRVGRYQVQRVIGVGGMGVVYEAEDTMLQRRVALKLLRPDLVAAEGVDLLAEAQSLARLSHGNVVAVHDVGLFSGQIYLCMEYVAGQTLRAWLEERTRTLPEILRVFMAAGRGLSYVHDAGLVHLDFKPDNVLVCPDGRVVVTDFGLSHMARRSSHEGGPRALLGTWAYMAPEQREGQALDARADQFGFCAALCEALGGKRDARELPSRRVPAWLRRVLTRGLSLSTEQRFASMDELLNLLEDGLVSEQRARERTRQLAVVLGSGLVLAWLLGGTVHAPQSVASFFNMLPRADVQSASARGAERSSVGSTSTVNTQGRSSGQEAPATAPGANQRATTTAPVASSSTSSSATNASAASGASSTSGNNSSSAGTRPPGGSSGGPTAPRDGECDDGVALTCAASAPSCPPGSVAAQHQGCWTCADVGSCQPLGKPRSCDDGSPLHCDQDPPLCASNQVASVFQGCWRCMDPFTCAQPSPPQPPKKQSKRATCGNGSCEGDEDHASCPDDCCPRDGSGNCVETCGNGTCEAREDHASCPMDCCELDSRGRCSTHCGNGMCEPPESHDTCASDCCETGPDGFCKPKCGNGMCELGETHESCPGECCAVRADGSCPPTCGNLMCEVGESHASCPSDCCELGPSGSCAPKCGNGMCEPGEDHESCPGECCELDAHGACVE